MRFVVIDAGMLWLGHESVPHCLFQSYLSCILTSVCDLHDVAVASWQGQSEVDPIALAQ